MMTMGMRMKKGVLHIVSNSVVPGADVFSDFSLFLRPRVARQPRQKKRDSEILNLGGT